MRNRPGYALCYAIDTSKLICELGRRLERIDFEAGLPEAITWYAANHTWWEGVREEIERGLRVGERNKAVYSFEQRISG